MRKRLPSASARCRMPMARGGEHVGGAGSTGASRAASASAGFPSLKAVGDHNGGRSCVSCGRRARARRRGRVCGRLTASRGRSSAGQIAGRRRHRRAGLQRTLRMPFRRPRPPLARTRARPKLTQASATRFETRGDAEGLSAHAPVFRRPSRPARKRNAPRPFQAPRGRRRSRPAGPPYIAASARPRRSLCNRWTASVPPSSPSAGIGSRAVHHPRRGERTRGGVALKTRPQVGFRYWSRVPSEIFHGHALPPLDLLCEFYKT